MKERDYQAALIKKLKKLFPGCMVLKNDEQYIQGIPDLTIFYKDRWAMLEVKIDPRASIRPNQEYYVAQANGMSFAAFINPENEEEVIRDLQQALRVS